MTFGDIINRLCALNNWSVTQLNSAAGIPDRTSLEKRSKPGGKEPFELKALRAACAHGATAEALQLLYGDRPVPNTLLATAMYPHIAPYEFEAVSRASHNLGHRPLSLDEIKGIVTECRRRGPPSHPQSAESAREELLRDTDPQQ